jgi:hypothetical protein
MKWKRRLNYGLVMIEACRMSGRVMLIAAILAATGPLASAQTIIKNFSGVNLGDTTGLGTAATPPDTMGAAGTNQFVEFINGAFAVYNKAGVRQALISDITFWENAGISAGTISAGLTDTRIIYDAGSGRWFATELTLDNVSNRVLVARSDSANPGGTWKALSFVGSSGSADFDTLGVDATGVYIGVNNFTSGGSFTGVSFFSIPKSDLVASTPTLANMTRFDNLNDLTYGSSLQGVSNPTNGPGHGVIIAIDDAAFKFIDRTTVNNSGSAGATLASRVRLSNTYDAFPNPAAQPSGQTVDAGDDRFSAAVRQSGSNIFMANTVLQGSHDAVHWLVLKESNNTILGEGIISNASFDFFYPSIAANSKGQFLMAFNRSGSTAPAGDISIYGAVGSVSNTTVTMGSPFLIQTGAVSDFTISFDSAPYRWGDYSTTMVDPTDDNLFWTIQEIPASNNSWGTQITLISLATNRPSLTIAPSGTNVLVAWPLSADPGYVLQSATSLVSPATWTAVTNAVTVSINQNVVSLPRPAAAKFFRLQE